MDYVELGSSGLRVSRLGLGTTNFGTTIGYGDAAGVIDAFIDRGGNLVDTANIYGRSPGGSANSDGAGASEMLLGKLMAGRRRSIVLATKGYQSMKVPVREGGVGLSRTNLIRSVNESLKRLQTDSIDLYQCHAWDPYTPVEETLLTLDDLVSSGKIRHVGVSNWDGWHVVKASLMTRSQDLAPIIADQIWYNLADRGAEHSIVPACRDSGVGVIAWGALAQGFLSGRYKQGARNAAPGTKLAQMKAAESAAWGRLATAQNRELLGTLDRIGKDQRTSIAAVAIRALLDLGGCDVVLVGGSAASHYKAALDSADLMLGESAVEELRVVSRPAERYPTDFYALFTRRESPYYGGLR